MVPVKVAFRHGSGKHLATFRTPHYGRVMEMLVFGHGYTAGRLTPLLRADGWRVTGTTRDHPDRLRQVQAEPLIWPGEDARVCDAITRADAVLVSIAPDAAGDPVLATFADRIARARPRWLGYLSTTGVYGDRQGGWVDEDSPLTPSTRRGQARVEAEAAWQALARAHDLPLHIFRLAGIYGPGRGPSASCARAQHGASSSPIRSFPVSMSRISRRRFWRRSARRSRGRSTTSATMNRPRRRM